MAMRLKARHLSAVALATLTGACGASGGGGGVVTTPPPVTGGPGTPTPTTPTPTPPNTSLMSPMVSETFAAQSVTGTARFGGTGTVPGAAGAAPLSIAYDASTNSYTLTTGGRSQTFRPANAVPGTGGTREYRVINGATQDSLVLTQPGTSGSLNYQYVGGGFWQRSTTGADAVDGSFDAFTYGVVTPDAGRPRTGRASYDVVLLGTMATSLNAVPLALSGNGQMIADFANGKVIGAGRLTGTDTSSGATALERDFALSASIGSSGGLTGRFGFSGFGPMEGSLDGRFYGPGADEVGATFAATGTRSSTPGASHRDVAVGAILGRKGTGGSPNTSFASITVTQGFFGDRARVAFTGTEGGSMTMGGSSTGGIGAFALPDNRTVLLTDDRTGTYMNHVMGVGTLIGGSYGGVGPIYDGSNANAHDWKPEGVKYLKTGRWYSVNGNSYVFDDYMYGFETAGSAVPRTGSAGYLMRLNGSIVRPDLNRVNLMNGIGGLTVNFATGAISTNGSYEFWDRSGAGNFTGTATLAGGASAFSGDFNLSGVGNFTGNWLGRFYGPAADEVGAVFRAASSNGSVATGTLAGAKNDAILGSGRGLADLESTTTLKGASMMTYTSRFDSFLRSMINSFVDVTYDPVAKTYAFTTASSGNVGEAQPVNMTFAPGDIDTSRSEAGYTFYRKGDATGKLLNLGPSNPVVQLTYTSFADVTMPATSNAAATRSFAYYGSLTSPALIPKAGTGRYDGVLMGRGVYPVMARDVEVSGTSRFDIDFGTGSWTAALAIVARDPVSGQSANVGTFNFVNTTGNDLWFNNINGRSANGMAHGGFLAGKFFGPNANEIGASFEVSPFNPTGQFGQSQFFWGVTVAKKTN